MPGKFNNKYRIDSARLKNWDYRWNAPYFITICTKEMIHYFGNVVKGEMQLNEIGKIAETEWLKTFEMRPDMNLFMGEYIIMPNHFHAILIIGENQYNLRRHLPLDATHSTDAMHCVSCENHNYINHLSDFPPDDTTDIPINPRDIPPNKSRNHFGPQSKNLASIIRGFKIGVTKSARTIDPNFAWQPRFHEHVIRNDRSYENISNYILNNPANWQKDKFS